MILIAGTTSMRWWTLVNMDDGWIDFSQSQVSVPAKFNKTNRDLTIPLTPQEAQWLREQLLARCAGTSLVFPRKQGTRWTIHSHFHKAVWSGACEKAGLEGFHFHWLRHTATSLMFDSGMLPHYVGMRRGDVDGGYEAWRTYCHPNVDEIGGAMERFGKWLEPGGQETDIASV
jgi:integrase